MTPVEQERAFLNAIAANRYDLAPRLAYSDWLEEQGRINMTIKVRKSFCGRVVYFEQESNGEISFDVNFYW